MQQLTFYLLKLFAEGKLPATTVQLLACAAWEDNWGHTDPIAEKLKGVGSNGAHSLGIVIRAEKGWNHEARTVNSRLTFSVKKG
jgi:hypothetical protein